VSAALTASHLARSLQSAGATSRTSAVLPWQRGLPPESGVWCRGSPGHRVDPLSALDGAAQRGVVPSRSISRQSLPSVRTRFVSPGGCCRRRWPARRVLLWSCRSGSVVSGPLERTETGE